MAFSNESSLEGPDLLTKFQHMNIVEAHVAITSSNHDQLPINNIACVISPSDRNLSFAIPLFPCQPAEIRTIHAINVVERPDAISSAKDDHVSLVRICSVRSSRRGRGPVDDGLSPSKRDGVKDVEVVEVVRSISPTKDEQHAVDHGGRVCTPRGR